MADEDDVLFARLNYLRDELNYLRAERDRTTSFDAFRADHRLVRAVERSLHLAIEACLDLGRRIIALEGFRFPDDNKDVFRILAEEGILPPDLASTMFEMAGFRNIIVHEYVRIDQVVVYGVLKKRLEDFEAFARSVQAWVRGR